MVIAAARDHVQMVVLHIDQRIARLIHIPRIRPDGTPDIHLQIFRIRHRGARHIAQTPPQAHSPAFALHKLCDLLQILPVLLSVPVILVHADVDDPGIPESRVFSRQRFLPDAFDEFHRLPVA